MSTTTDPIAPAPAMPEPEWIRVKQAVAWSGISESTLYTLMAAKRFKSLTLRERGQARGTRLISFPSLRAFLESKAEGGMEP
ncbi:MAG: hypothetical protein V4726_15965 [Verrucomicrobiota bacterium]